MIKTAKQIEHLLSTYCAFDMLSQFNLHSVSMRLDGIIQSL